MMPRRDEMDPLVDETVPSEGKTTSLFQEKNHGRTYTDTRVENKEMSQPETRRNASKLYEQNLNKIRSKRLISDA
jgi:hypothetical protein